MLSDGFHVDPFLAEDSSPSGVTPSENVTIVGDVQMDLPNYISNYHGYIYYQRLFYIAQRCPALRSTALRLAHDYIKKSTLDTASYNKIFLMLAEQVTTPFNLVVFQFTPTNKCS
ncbi:hypothetical protein AHF37_12444 [Paragonimus kellicotti]|nr:hypothetical protein AHF37_12444 [Paragonimus kellicotti]